MRVIICLFLCLVSAPALAASPATVVVMFDRSRIQPALAEGLADKATARPVTADDPVRVASISKLVTALGVMRLVEQHRLSLNRDVSDYLGWRLRNPAFPDRPITLRLLLSHQSSLTDGANYIVPLGETLRQRLADPRAWDARHAPGSGWFAYANINPPVIASVMEAATGERFDRLMQRLVLRPLKLDACYNWSGCTKAKTARAVVLYRDNGEVAKDDLHGSAPTCPVLTAEGAACALETYTPGWNGALFSPQGGLRISMHDLARIGQMLARGSRGFLQPETFAEMTRAQWHFTGANRQDDPGAEGFFCAFGLGVQLIGSGAPGCRDGLFTDLHTRLGHAGEAYGLRSGLWFDPASGCGVAFFTTQVPDHDPGNRSAFTKAEERVVDRATR
ncbi:serine hydrolase [Novosphingobium sp.]|uniref:serine hydrolase domain-containing protein n=1 Tax=Novosphingobium sp. TaxID=1874826 RepID=UPI0025DC526F|nr:serine hydrolase [Novosphingobium sp.]